MGWHVGSFRHGRVEKGICRGKGVCNGLEGRSWRAVVSGGVELRPSKPVVPLVAANSQVARLVCVMVT